MISFDAQAILDAIDAGNAHDEWKVYRARKGYFLEWGASLWLLALIMCAVGAAVIVGLILAPPASWTGESAPMYYVFWLLGPLCLLISYFFAWQGCVLLGQIPGASKQVLVLNPEGIVARQGPQSKIPLSNSSIISPTTPWAGAKDGVIFSILYDRMASAHLQVERSRYEERISLILTFVAPRRILSWRIDPRFPACDTIAQSIIEGYMRYEAQQSEAQSARKPNGQE